MATCKAWGQAIGFPERGFGGMCQDCFLKSITPQAQAAAAVEAAELDKHIVAVLLTTETAPNLQITRRIEVVTAECAFGMNMLKDLFAGVRNVVGGRSEAVQDTMRDARRTALLELKREAHLVGANAVVGVSLNYVSLGGPGTMVMLVATGTAVVIET